LQRIIEHLFDPRQQDGHALRKVFELLELLVIHFHFLGSFRLRLAFEQSIPINMDSHGISIRLDALQRCIGFDVRFDGVN
jgi:hypothetical protein